MLVMLDRWGGSERFGSMEVIGSAFVATEREACEVMGVSSRTEVVSFGVAWGFSEGDGLALYVEPGQLGLAMASSDEELWPVQVERGLDDSFGRRNFQWSGP